MLDIDLSSPVNEVRAIIGDWHTEWVADSVIQHYLDKNNGDVILAADDTLSAIISHAAYMLREEVGDVEIYWKDLYEQLNNLKDKLEKDTLYKRTKNLFAFGGTTKSEVKRVANSNERTYISVTNEQFEGLFKRLHPCIEEPYRLCFYPPRY